VPVFYVLVQPEGAPEASRVDLTDKVLSFEYTDSETKTDILKLTVDNWDLSNFDDPIWKPGNTLIVSWGYVGYTVPARTCIIQKVSGSTQISVEAQSKDVLMNKVGRVRTFENKTRSEIVDEIARQNGFLDPSTRDIEVTTKRLESVAQTGLTDMQFIKRLAQLEGKEFYVDHAGFHWHQRRTGQRPSRVIQWYLPPAVGDIISFDVDIDVFAKPAKVVAKGHDPVKGKDITVTASKDETPAPATGIEALLVSIFGEIGGASLPVEPDAEANMSVDPRMSVNQNLTSEEVRSTTEVDVELAELEAAGRYRKTSQAAIKLSVELVGDPGIAAKSILDIRGISKRLSGKYFVNEAVHKIGTSGYTLSLKCTTNGTNGYPAAATAPANTQSTPNTEQQPNTQEAPQDYDALLVSKYGEVGAVSYRLQEERLYSGGDEGGMSSTSSSSQ
jgi:phage protein D